LFNSSSLSGLWIFIWYAVSVAYRGFSQMLSIRYHVGTTCLCPRKL